MHESLRSCLAAAVLLGLGLPACSEEAKAPKADAHTTTQDSATLRADRSPESPDGPTDLCQRWVLKDEVYNARDLGGYALDAGHRSACATVYRGGDLTRLQEKGCAEFKQLGIKSVIDLRQEAEQTTSPNALCISETATKLAAGFPKLLPDSPENYIALLDASGPMKSLFQHLGKAETYPTFIHCVIGRDRTSVTAALVLLVAGADRATVIKEFELSEEANVEIKTPSLAAFLDEVEKRGGAETYLKALGITDAELGVLRSKLRVASGPTQ